MGREPANPIVRLPGWVVIVFSVVVVFHFFAVVMCVMATPNGPWPGDEGATMGDPPTFAYDLYRRIAFPYLKLFKFNYHFNFAGNRPGQEEIAFEVRLKDAKGQQTAVLNFPEDDVNPWVRHRQAILARSLGNDEPVMPGQGESIPAPGQSARTIEIWDDAEGQQRKLRTVSQHLVPRDRPIFRPLESAMISARAYVRYLCRTHGAASGELIRIHQPPIPPMAMFRGDLQSAPFQKMSSNFGELPR